MILKKMDDFFTKDNVSSEIIKFLLSEKHELIIINKNLVNDLFNCLNKHITNLMTYKQSIKYAVYAAELVLPIFEKQYPNDNRSRKCIEAAKLCIDDPSEENQRNAYTPYSTARNASSYVTSYYASYAAAFSNKSISCFYASSTFYSASKVAANIDNKKIRNKIINYGLELLEGL